MVSSEWKCEIGMQGYCRSIGELKEGGPHRLQETKPQRVSHARVKARPPDRRQINQETFRLSPVSVPGFPGFPTTSSNQPGANKPQTAEERVKLLRCKTGA